MIGLVRELQAQELELYDLMRAMLDACVVAAKAKGQSMIRISVLASNHRARKVYAKAGFQEHLITLIKPLT